MKFINKFEDKLNQIIYWILSLIKKLTPKPLRKVIHKLSSNTKLFKKRIQNALITKIKFYVLKLKELNNHFFTKAESMKDFSFSEKINEKKMKLLIYYKSNSIRSILKDLVVILITTFSILKTKKRVLRFFSLIFIVTSSFIIFNISNKSSSQNRQIASKRTKLFRPAHNRFKRRTLKVLNVSIPVFLNNKKDFHSFLTDFYIRTNTVFAKLYLDHNQHMIRNRFYENTYRMPSSYPLDDDGKRVIKEKIILELNALLEDNKVEGKVLEVSFDAPIGN